MCCLCGYAQSDKPINVFVKVVSVSKGADGVERKVDIGNCDVYVFDTQKKASDFHDQQQKMITSEAGGVISDVDYSKSAIDHALTDPNNGGDCQVVALEKWFIVASRDILLSDVIRIKDKINANNEIEIQVKSEIRELQNVTTTAQGKEFEPEIDVISVGDLRQIIINWPVLGANATWRYGLSPFATVAGDSYGFTSEYQNRNPEADSLLKKMVPYVVDGELYGKTQLRKMGYDLAHDPLFEYTDTTQKIITNSKQPIIFKIRDALQPVDQEAVYPIYGLLWRENYGNLVLIEKTLLDPGYATNPMRFIDLALPDVEINAANYYYRARTDLNEGTESLPLNFVRGEARISPTDSVGLQSLDKIIETLYEIKRNDGNVFGIKIHGYASPEGGKATNERLSRQRSEYLVSMISERFGRLNSETGATVASWKEVADLLRKDSIADPENISRAEQIEQIIASSNSEAQVDSRMQSSSLYSFLREHEDKYYKPLRKVEITYQYSVQKELTREEVIQRYRDKVDILYPYQFQYLFEYLKDKPEELEPVAKKAMELRETRKMGKPWTLAAYYLAKCYLARDTCDLTLLEPYITLTGKEIRDELPGSAIRHNGKTLLNAKHYNRDGDFVQHINDEGVVMLQVSMLLNAKKVSEASTLAKNLFKGHPKYDKSLKILQCLTGGWNDPAVRDTVASTSKWNAVVVYAAQSDESTKERYWRQAWELLTDSTSTLYSDIYPEHTDSMIFRMNTARELYMRATLAYRLYSTAKNWSSRKDDKTPVSERFFDAGNYDIFAPNTDFEDTEYPWGAIMIKACEMAPSMIRTLKFDGEFNQNYRDGFAEYWNKIHPDNILK